MRSQPVAPPRDPAPARPLRGAEQPRAGRAAPSPAGDLLPLAAAEASGNAAGGGPRAALPPPHLADLDLPARRTAIAALGEPAYRAGQVSRHYFGRLVRDPVAMTDLPATARGRITEALLPTLLTTVQERTADAGATRKALWRLHDGSLVEGVLMEYPDRVTACVSSQAGCGMGCPFCATGQAGLTRNLSTAEIVDQVVSLAATASGELGRRLSRVVFMGMGEPLANYTRVVAAVRRLVAPPPEGLGLSQRHLTLSTVGLVPAMRRLAGEELSVTLALSLHAPDDDLRDELVPVNQRWRISEVLAAAWDYAARTGRRVSVEYAMIRGVNDQPWRADRLGQLLAGRPVHVNLIPLNPTPGSATLASRTGVGAATLASRTGVGAATLASRTGVGAAAPAGRTGVGAAAPASRTGIAAAWEASPKPVEREFVRRLRAAGVNTTVRDTRGREIDGACGQLAARTERAER